MTEPMLGPTTDTKTMISSSGGIDMIVSVNRMIAWSTSRAVEAGGEAEQRADHEVERDRAEADDDRRPPAVQQARPDVAPDDVRAEEVQRARRLACAGLEVDAVGRPRRQQRRQDAPCSDDHEDARRTPTIASRWRRNRRIAARRGETCSPTTCRRAESTGPPPGPPASRALGSSARGSSVTSRGRTARADRRSRSRCRR